MASIPPFRRALALAGLALLLVAPLASADEPAAPDAVFDALERHGVTVAITFQRDVRAEERGVTPPDSKGTPARYRLWRMSWIRPGYVVKDRRTVLVADLQVSPSSIQSIRVRTAGGFECEATLQGFLVDAEGAVLRTQEDLPVPPVAFPQDAGEARYAGSIREGPDEFEMWVEDLHLVRTAVIGKRSARGYDLPDRPFGALSGSSAEDRTVDLVTDAAGRAVGFRFSSFLPADGRWTAPRVLASKVVTFEQLRVLEDAAAKDSPLHHLKVTFRVQSRHDRDAQPWYMRRSTAEQEYYGLAVAPDLLVVAAQLEDEQVRRILSLELEGEEDGVKATWLGRLRGYHAFLVRVEGKSLTCLPETSPASPPTGAALLVHRVAKRGGVRRDEIKYDRVAGYGRGYADGKFLASERGIPSGAVLRTADGAIFGLAARLHPEDRERRIGDSRRPSRSRTPFLVVAIPFAELGSPAELGERVDDRVMPSEEAEAKRLPWLGVEYDDVDKGLAELLDISAPTRDGKRGLIVVAVHVNSPAARAGLKGGDVLLAARRVSAPGGPPVDLDDPSGSGGGFRGMFGGAPAPWRSRDNALVKLLKDWGVGTTWELTWLRDRVEQKTALDVEIAPPDFRSAPRTFDEETGLEVRDLTYEVRHVLRMADDATGVVVARREPGTPAAQARLLPNELILELDGRPIASAEAFGEMLKAARAEERRVVRLVVRRLGRTRLVDLRVSSPGGAAPDAEAPAEEEGS